MQDVEKLVGQGETILLSRHDRMNRLKRYLDANKRTMAVKAGSLAAATALGGPIGLAAAAGAGLLAFAAKQAWERFWVWRITGKYRDFKARGGSTTRQVDFTNSKGKTFKVAQVDEDGFGKNFLKDLSWLLANQGLTDVYNAFENMAQDLLELQTWAAVNEANGSARITKPIKTCDDAIRLWESVARVRWRYERVGEAGEVLEDLLEYVTLVISKYDADVRMQSKRLWANVTGHGQADPAAVADVMNDVVNELGLRKHAFRMLGRKLDYSAWAFSVLPDFVQNESFGRGFATKMKLEIIRRANPTDYHRLITTGLGATGKAALTLGVGQGVGSIGVGTTANILFTQGTAGFQSGAAVGAAFQGAATAVGPNVSAAVEAVLEQVLNLANEAWNEYKLRTGWTLDVTGWRLQTVSEKIRTLRDVSKAEATTYVDVLKLWSDADAKSRTAGSTKGAAEALLRFHLAESEFYRNRTGRMLEDAARAVIVFNRATKGITDAAEKAVDHFVTNHPAGFCQYGEGCYAPLLNGIRGLGFEPLPQDKGKAENVPCFRVKGEDYLERCIKVGGGQVSVKG